MKNIQEIYKKVQITEKKFKEEVEYISLNGEEGLYLISQKVEFNSWQDTYLLGGERLMVYGSGVQGLSYVSLSHIITDFFEEHGIKIFGYKVLLKVKEEDAEKIYKALKTVSL